MIAAILRGVEVIAWAVDGTMSDCFQGLQERHKDEDRRCRVREFGNLGKD